MKYLLIAAALMLSACDSTAQLIQEEASNRINTEVAEQSMDFIKQDPDLQKMYDEAKKDGVITSEERDAIFTEYRAKKIENAVTSGFDKLPL